MQMNRLPFLENEREMNRIEAAETAPKNTETPAWKPPDTRRSCANLPSAFHLGRCQTRDQTVT